MADAEVATGTGQAFGAALVINQGQKTIFRTGMGGYACITGTTQVMGEEGEWMPGMPRYDTMISFFPPQISSDDDATKPIKIVGGRSFIKDVFVRTAGVAMDITNDSFIAQIRRHRYSRHAMMSMTTEVIDGLTGHVRLTLTPEQTGWLVLWMVHGVWDLEMLRGGNEYTIIPESTVHVTPGISQGTLVPDDVTLLGVGVGVGFDATVVIT